jgi:hypothetical protein
MTTETNDSGHWPEENASFHSKASELQEIEAIVKFLGAAFLTQLGPSPDRTNSSRQTDTHFPSTEAHSVFEGGCCSGSIYSAQVSHCGPKKSRLHAHMQPFPLPPHSAFAGMFAVELEQDLQELEASPCEYLPLAQSLQVYIYE